MSNLLKIIYFVLQIYLLTCSLQRSITQDTVPDGRTCGSLRPTISAECTSVNTNNIFCCFMTNPQGQPFCLRFNSTDWSESDSWENNGTTYSMRCDVVEFTPPSNSTNSTDPFLSTNTPVNSADRCGNANPSISSDCTSENNFNQYCCYLSPVDGGISICKKMTPSSFQPSITTMTVGSINYNLSCDVGEGSPASPCGSTNPQSSADCTSQSTENNSCCWYDQGSNPQCLWYGSKADTSVNTSKFVCS